MITIRNVQITDYEMASVLEDAVFKLHQEARPDYFVSQTHYSKEEFEELIREDRLVEYACYCGNYYGTPRDYVEDQMDQGRDVILEIELQGALKIKEKYPEALLLFVMPPNPLFW